MGRLDNPLACFPCSLQTAAAPSSTNILFPLLPQPSFPGVAWLPPQLCTRSSDGTTCSPEPSVGVQPQLIKGRTGPVLF